MPRSRRRRRLTTLLLLLWQGAVLAPVAVAAHAPQQMPAGESQSFAQATMPAPKGIPAEVVQWFDAMKEAADKGDGAKALQMHEKVVAWVQANLPEKHVFRARVMVRYGYVLSKLEKHQDALIPTRGGAEMLRELAKINQDPDIRYYLSIALYNLGINHGKLDQAESAASAYNEALPILREQEKTRGDSRDILLDTLTLQSIQLTKLKQFHPALAASTEALTILRPLAKDDSDKRERLGMTLFSQASTYTFLGEFKSSLQARKEAVEIFRSLASTHPSSRKLLPDSLIVQGLEFSISGDPLQSIAPLNEAISILRSREHTNDSLDDLAGALTSLGDANMRLGKTNQALTQQIEAVKIYREISLNDKGRREALASALDSLSGYMYFSVGNYKAALQPSMEAVSIFRQLATMNPSIKTKLASSLGSLASIQNNLGQIQSALLTIEESVRIQRELGAMDIHGLTSLGGALSRMAAIYGSLEQWEKALAARKEAVEIRRRVMRKVSNNSAQITPLMRGARLDIDFPWFLIMDLRLLSSNYSSLGKSQEALASQQEAVILARQLATSYPEERKLLAEQLTSLASVLSDAGQLHAALDASLEAVQLSRDLAKTNSKEQELLGDALYDLSLRHSALGRRQEALAYSREAMALWREQKFKDPSKSTQLADSQSVVAYNLSNLGHPQEAALLAKDAVNLFRQSELNKTWQRGYLAWGLSLLSYHYSQAGDHLDALLAARESVAIYRELAKVKPLYSVEVAIPLIVLGLSQYNLGKIDLALASTNEAIQLLRNVTETDLFKRAELANALNNLSQFKSVAGRQDQAMAAAEESVAILRELSNTTPDVLDQLSKSTTTLATLSLRQAQPAAAIPLLREAVSSEVRFLQQQLPLMPEGRRQALVDTLGRRWELPYSLALQGEAGASLALYTRLNRHGPLQDIERRQAMISRSSGATQALVNRLSILNSQISNPTITAKARQNALAEAERLQEDLYRQLPALQSRLVEIAEVARQLPPDGVLVEFQRFAPYNAAKPEKDAWGKPRYLALLLDQRGTLRAVDLGEADAVDRAIATALDRTRFQQPGADRAWALVAETLFFPLRGSLEGKRQLLLSPDGQLHRVPFGALALLAGSTPSLPATLTLHTIGSGRDLVPLGGPTLTSPPPPASAALVLADPQTTGWAPLVRAASEGQTVAASLSGKLLLGPAASVAELERARGPRILHVAGHGYFNAQATGDPLLASGLALAGADKARQPSRQSNPQPSSTASAPNPQPTTPSPAPSGMPSDDGYLTAKEAARLQLDGTQLVVLSACESGLGSERSGEGLFGLRRALTVAGARGTLLSLWKVPEHATETFMTRFYTLLGQGIPPGQAVRRVQAEFRADPRIDGWSDPFYWAGWQYSGLPDTAR